MIVPLRTQELQEGAGVTVRRLFPTVYHQHHDPFVLLDEFTVTPPAHFPEHPHRGFEAVTYILAGGFRHRDSLGNDVTVYEHSLQRFTAGRGIVHAEYPVEQGAHGLQLWITLPRALKDILPDYQAVRAEELPTEILRGGQRRILIGQGSPLHLHTPVEYSDIELSAGARYEYAIPQGWQGFVYVLQGTVRIGPERLQRGEGALLSNELLLYCFAPEPARFVLAVGKPWHESIRLLGSAVL